MDDPSRTDRPMKLLVVEDERDVADMYLTWLEEAYDVEVAYSGEDAKSRIDDSFDLILLDRRMPGISGDEVLEWIREEAFDCYVAMITAVDPDLSIVEMEFQEYLVKPISAEELHEAVESLLTQKQQEDRIKQLFQLSLRLSTLESKLTMRQLQESTKYWELQEELETVWEEFEAEQREGTATHIATVEKIQSIFTSASAQTQTQSNPS